MPRQRTGHVVLVKVGEGVVGRGEQLLRRGVGTPGGDRGRPPRGGAAGGEHALGVRRGQGVEDGQAEALGDGALGKAISCPAARTGAFGRWRSGWPRRPGRRSRWLAILAISMSAAARSCAGEFSTGASRSRRMASRVPTSRTHTISGKPNCSPVGRGQLDEPLRAPRRSAGSGPAVDWSRTESSPASPVGHPVRAEVGVVGDQLVCWSVAAPRQQRLLERDPQVMRVRERPPVVGLLGHPGRALEQPAERAARTPPGTSR